MRFLFLKLISLLCAVLVVTQEVRPNQIARRSGFSDQASSNNLQSNVSPFVKSMSLRLIDRLPFGQVTWDQYSFMINGERLMLFSGEVHPYRQGISFVTV